MNKDQAFNNLRSQSLRITQARKAIIDVLEGKHLTLHEIYEAMKLKGYHNLSTVYNNLDFLLKYKIITQIFVQGKKHYDLAIEETSHNADSHIHVSCTASDNIIEINQKDVFEKIKKHPAFKGFDVSKIQLVVEGSCPRYDEDMCKDVANCYLTKISKED